jgi:hypothetical protein
VTTLADGTRIKVRVPTPSTPSVVIPAVEVRTIKIAPFATGGGGTYTHVQAAPAATWIITHNLGFPREPTVLMDTAPTVAVITDVAHSPGFNVTTLTFASPVTGKAFF